MDIYVYINMQNAVRVRGMSARTCTCRSSQSLRFIIMNIRNICIAYNIYIYYTIHSVRDLCAAAVFSLANGTFFSSGSIRSME